MRTPLLYLSIKTTRFAVAVFMAALLMATTTVGAKAFRHSLPPVADTLVVDADEDTTAVEEMANTFATDTTVAWTERLKQGMDELTQNEMFEHSQVAVLIYDLTADSAVYELNSRQLMRPASVQKLLTSITALSNLGGSFQFTTRLYTTSAVKDSILAGDVYIVGGFDPRFGADDMEAFIEALKGKGLKRIDGHIYADVSLKDTLKWGEGWCWDDEEKTLTPLLYNGQDTFMKHFFDKLDENGIGHAAGYTYRLLPGDSVQLVCERSHTMDQILMRMLKRSDNLYAEALFYQLGAKQGQHYPSAKVSARRVNDFIASLGLSPDDYNVADGSGLSLYNYVTCQLVVRALRYAWQRNNIYLHLYPALPIAGEDGTLSGRMRSGNACGNVHAKTGTLRGVSTLAGYATTTENHQVCFCILNQGIRSNAAGHRFQDRVCRLIADL